MTGNVHEAVSRTSLSLKAVFGSVENLQYFDKIIVWGTKFFQSMIHDVPPGLDKLVGFVGVTEMFIDGVMGWSYANYFFRKRTEAEYPEKLAKVDGKVYRAVQDKRDVKIGQSKFMYHLTNKPHLAMGMVGYAGAYITCTARLLESMKIPVMATISEALGGLPMIGHTVSQGFMSHFVLLGGYSLVVGHTAMVWDSIRYISLAMNDSSKDMTKGVLKLAARVASLTLDTLLVTNVTDPVVLGIAGLAAGILGVTAAVYTYNRKLDKLAEQAQLLELGKKQNPVAA